MNYRNLLVMEVSPCYSIQEAITDAWCLSMAHIKTVVFEFNGRSVEVDAHEPGNNVNKVYLKWAKEAFAHDKETPFYDETKEGSDKNIQEEVDKITLSMNKFIKYCNKHKLEIGWNPGKLPTEETKNRYVNISAKSKKIFVSKHSKGSCEDDRV